MIILQKCYDLESIEIEHTQTFYQTSNQTSNYTSNQTAIPNLSFVESVERFPFMIFGVLMLIIGPVVIFNGTFNTSPAYAFAVLDICALFAVLLLAFMVFIWSPENWYDYPWFMVWGAVGLGTVMELVWLLFLDEKEDESVQLEMQVADEEAVLYDCGVAAAEEDGSVSEDETANEEEKGIDTPEGSDGADEGLSKEAEQESLLERAGLLRRVDT